MAAAGTGATALLHHPGPNCVDDPNFATICSFLENFGETCNIAFLPFDRLQNMLEDTTEVSQELSQIHIVLLRRIYKSINTEKWEKHLAKFCHSYNSQDAWEVERFGYKKSKIQTKLRLLKNLMESQFDYNVKFKNEVNKRSADALRPVPLGRDSEGQVYWYQVDVEANLRIYREDVDDDTWQLVATNRDEMTELINQLTNGIIHKNNIVEGENGSGDGETPLKDGTPIDTGSGGSSLCDDDGMIIDEDSLHEDDKFKADQSKVETMNPVKAEVVQPVPVPSVEQLQDVKSVQDSSKSLVSEDSETVGICEDERMKLEEEEESKPLALIVPAQAIPMRWESSQIAECPQEHCSAFAQFSESEEEIVHDLSMKPKLPPIQVQEHPVAVGSQEEESTNQMEAASDSGTQQQQDDTDVHSECETAVLTKMSPISESNTAECEIVQASIIPEPQVSSATSVQETAAQFVHPNVEVPCTTELGTEAEQVTMEDEHEKRQVKEIEQEQDQPIGVRSSAPLEHSPFVSVSEEVPQHSPAARQQDPSEMEFPKEDVLDVVESTEVKTSIEEDVIQQSEISIEKNMLEVVDDKHEDQVPIVENQIREAKGREDHTQYIESQTPLSPEVIVKPKQQMEQVQSTAPFVIESSEEVSGETEVSHQPEVIGQSEASGQLEVSDQPEVESHLPPVLEVAVEANVEIEADSEKLPVSETNMEANEDIEIDLKMPLVVPELKDTASSPAASLEVQHEKETEEELVPLQGKDPAMNLEEQLCTEPPLQQSQASPSMVPKTPIPECKVSVSSNIEELQDDSTEENLGVRQSEDKEISNEIMDVSSENQPMEVHQDENYEKQPRPLPEPVLDSVLEHSGQVEQETNSIPDLTTEVCGEMETEIQPVPKVAVETGEQIETETHGPSSSKELMSSPSVPMLPEGSDEELPDDHEHLVKTVPQASLSPEQAVQPDVPTEIQSTTELCQELPVTVHSTDDFEKMDIEMQSEIQEDEKLIKIDPEPIDAGQASEVPEVFQQVPLEIVTTLSQSQAPELMLEIAGQAPEVAGQVPEVAGETEEMEMNSEIIAVPTLDKPVESPEQSEVTSQTDLVPAVVEDAADTTGNVDTEPEILEDDSNLCQSGMILESKNVERELRGENVGEESESVQVSETEPVEKRFCEGSTSDTCDAVQSSTNTDVVEAQQEVEAVKTIVETICDVLDIESETKSPIIDTEQGLILPSGVEMLHTPSPLQKHLEILDEVSKENQLKTIGDECTSSDANPPSEIHDDQHQLDSSVPVETEQQQGDMDSALQNSTLVGEEENNEAEVQPTQSDDGGRVSDKDETVSSKVELIPLNSPATEAMVASRTSDSKNIEAMDTVSEACEVQATASTNSGITTESTVSNQLSGLVAYDFSSDEDEDAQDSSISQTEIAESKSETANSKPSEIAQSKSSSSEMPESKSPGIAESKYSEIAQSKSSEITESKSSEIPERKSPEIAESKSSEIADAVNEEAPGKRRAESPILENPSKLPKLDLNQTETSEAKASLLEAPSIPEENPTIPEENPTIPEENPTIPEENPTIPEENPTIPEENPIIGEAIEEEMMFIVGEGAGAELEGGNPEVGYAGTGSLNNTAESIESESSSDENVSPAIPTRGRGRGRPPGRKPPGINKSGAPRKPGSGRKPKQPVVQDLDESSNASANSAPTSIKKKSNGRLTVEIPTRQSSRIAKIQEKEEEQRRKLEEERLAQLKAAQIRKQQQQQEREQKQAKGLAEEEDGTEKPKPRKGRPPKTASKYLPTLSGTESDEEVETAIQRSKKRGRKRKHEEPPKTLMKKGLNPWIHTSSEDEDEVEEEEEEHDIHEEEEEDMTLRSDHEFSPESDMGDDDGDASPSRHARTVKRGEVKEDKYADTNCNKCGKGDHPEWILLCDSCDKGWHASCLRPVIWVIPEGQWFCPTCQHKMLIEKLNENLVEYDKIVKKHELEVLRKQRLAYVGISLDNVLPPNNQKEETQNGKPIKQERIKKKRRQISSDDEEDELMQGGGRETFIDDRDDSSNLSRYNSDESEDEPMYKLRARRTTKSFNFKEYDDMINSALRNEDEYELPLLEGEATKPILPPAQENGETGENDPPPPKLVPSKGKVMPGSSDEEDEEENQAKEKKDESSDEEDIDETERNRRKELEKQSNRKSRRRLNDLDAPSDEDSDEDFKGSEEDDEEDEPYAVEDEDSEWSGDRDADESDDSIAKRGKKGKLGRQEKYLDVGSVRRSSRKARSRIVYDESDQEDDDDEPAGGWGSESEASSLSESDDETWGKRKKKKTSYHPPSKLRKSAFFLNSGGSSSSKSKSTKKRPSLKKKKKVDEDDSDRAWSKHGGKVKKADTESSTKRSTRGKQIDFKGILESGESDDDGNIHPKRQKPVVPDLDMDSQEPSSSKQLVAELNAAQALAATTSLANAATPAKLQPSKSSPNKSPPLKIKSPKVYPKKQKVSPPISLVPGKSTPKKKSIALLSSSEDSASEEPSKLVAQLLKPVPAPPFPPIRRPVIPTAPPPVLPPVPVIPTVVPQEPRIKTPPPTTASPQRSTTPPVVPAPPLPAVSQPSTNLMMSEILASSGRKKQQTPPPPAPTTQKAKHQASPPPSPGVPPQIPLPGPRVTAPQIPIPPPTAPIPGSAALFSGKATPPHRGLSSPPHQAHTLLPPSEISRVPNPAYYPQNQGMRFPWERNIGPPPPPYQVRGAPSPPQGLGKAQALSSSIYPPRSGYIPPPTLRIPNPGSGSGPPLQSFQQFKREPPGPPQMMYRMPPQGNCGGRGIPPPNILAHLQSSHERFFGPHGGFGGPPTSYGIPPQGPLYPATQPQQFDYRPEEAEFKEEGGQERRPSSPAAVPKEENKSDGEFGGLVSYFSSQRGEEDMDT